MSFATALSMLGLLNHLRWFEDDPCWQMEMASDSSRYLFSSSVCSFACPCPAAGGTTKHAHPACSVLDDSVCNSSPETGNAVFSSLSQRLQRSKDELSAYLNRNNVQGSGVQTHYRRSLPVESPLEAYGKKGRDLLLSAQNLVSFISPSSKEGYSSKSEISSSELLLRIENLEVYFTCYHFTPDSGHRREMLDWKRKFKRRREEEEDFREDLLKRCRIAEALRDEALDSFDEAMSQLKYLERKFKEDSQKADEELQRIQDESGTTSTGNVDALSLEQKTC
eukprot:768261-Hanusia_phi.AAC.6